MRSLGECATAVLCNSRVNQANHGVCLVVAQATLWIICNGWWGVLVKMLTGFHARSLIFQNHALCCCKIVKPESQMNYDVLVLKTQNIHDLKMDGSRQLNS